MWGGAASPRLFLVSLGVRGVRVAGVPQNHGVEDQIEGGELVLLTLAVRLPAPAPAAGQIARARRWEWTSNSRSGSSTLGSIAPVVFLSEVGDSGSPTAPSLSTDKSDGSVCRVPSFGPGRSAGQ